MNDRNEKLAACCGDCDCGWIKYLAEDESAPLWCGDCGYTDIEIITERELFQIRYGGLDSDI